MAGYVAGPDYGDGAWDSIVPSVGLTLAGCGLPVTAERFVAGSPAEDTTEETDELSPAMVCGVVSG